MQRALNAGAVIRVELARALVHVINLSARYFVLPQVDLMVHETGSGDAA
jgi:hypothetical protein